MPREDRRTYLFAEVRHLSPEHRHTSAALSGSELLHQYTDKSQTLKVKSMLQNLDSKPREPAQQWQFSGTDVNSRRTLKVTLQRNPCLFQHATPRYLHVIGKQWNMKWSGQVKIFYSENSQGFPSSLMVSGWLAHCDPQNANKGTIRPENEHLSVLKKNYFCLCNSSVFSLLWHRLVFLRDNTAPPPRPSEAVISSHTKTYHRTYYHSRFTHLATEDKGS